MNLCLRLIPFFCCFFCLSANAYHIIGGDLSYECLGNDEYAFELIVYRDCSNPSADNFDARAPMTIYLKNGTGYDLFSDEQVSLVSVRDVEPNLDNPCLQVPPRICIEEAVYRLTTTLPKSTQSYHITYQRCCRNSTISNINRPAEIGITFTVEITPNAQDVCNNGPQFNNFPPIVICANEPISFDHSASDLDGDQIIYEFCAPLQGGGTVGFLQNGDPASCNGFRPNPSCPPPYAPIQFIVPTYTATEPVPGEPPLRIDPNTGVITGTPNRQGQYVVGVCATEFRNGQAISVLRRDFQFNVANCTPTVIARLRGDDVIDNELFILRECGENRIQFQNQSFQVSNIENLVWRFDFNGTINEFTDWHPTVDFPGAGNYTGQLILNEGLPCNDTADIIVNISPEIKPEFSAEYDTCVAGRVAFSNLTNLQGVGIEKTDWLLGDGNTASEDDFSHLYQDPGMIPVVLRLEDENECIWKTTKLVEYFPAPALIVIAPDDFLGCDPADIFFNNLSFPIDDTYDIQWDFGDGNVSDEISPTNPFRMPGVFDIKVKITSPIGCSTDTIFESLIEILPHPIADFSFTPERLNQFERTVDFSDESQHATRWFWDFGDDAVSLEQNPNYTFRDTGKYQIMQVAIHPEGCRDTTFAEIDIAPEVRYFLPNAFSPNHDTKNDFFEGVGDFTAISSFKMAIWNRWGEVVFESDDPINGWNGRKNNVGKEVPNGVYVVKVNYQSTRGEVADIQGVVTVVR